jgi:hypothetical protein
MYLHAIKVVVDELAVLKLALPKQNHATARARRNGTVA